MATLVAEAQEAALCLIAERAQMLTQASGAAIALRQGDLMLCRARAGTTAPVMGAELDTQSGLSGECVRTARTLVCHDTESDPRVNLDVCRHLGIRSVALFPICLEGDVVGVFEAFSARPGGFSGNEVPALESVRDLISWVLRRGSQAESPDAPALECAAEVEPPGAPFQRAANRAALSFRPVEDNPPLAPFRPTVAPDLDEDLICEIEQQAESKPQSGTITPALHVIQAESQQLEEKHGFALAAGGDPEDGLICGIEKRSAGQLSVLEPVSHSANSLSSFNPAAARPPEHVLSRKLMLAGVLVMVAGLIWLRWCNPAQHAARYAPANHTLQAASTAPASPIAAVPTLRNAEWLLPALRSRCTMLERSLLFFCSSNAYPRWVSLDLTQHLRTTTNPIRPRRDSRWTAAALVQERAKTTAYYMDE